jgi:hypothetical protein
LAKKFPWGCVIGGCAATIVLVLVVVGVGGFFGVRALKRFGESLADPDKRAERVMEILGAETLPEGLYPGIAFSFPYVADFVFLVDSPPKEGGEPGEMGSRGLIYFSVRADQHEQRELERFLEGEDNDAELLRQNDIRLDLDHVIGRGAIDGQDSPIRWVAYTGRLLHHGHGAESLITMLQPDCDDARMRIGVWLRPLDELPPGLTPPALPDGSPPTGSDPGEGGVQPAVPGAEPLEPSQEVIDAFESGISEFVDHFRFCGA